MGEGALAAVQECAREVIEGALAGLLFTAVALQSRLVVICPPGTNIVALTSGTLEGTILPPQRMDVRLTLVDVEEWSRTRDLRILFRGFSRSVCVVSTSQSSGLKSDF